MFVNELSINTCSPRRLKKDSFRGEHAGFQFLFTPRRQTEESWLRTDLGAGPGLQSRGRSAAFVPGTERLISMESVRAVVREKSGSAWTQGC